MVPEFEERMYEPIVVIPVANDFSSGWYVQPDRCALDTGRGIAASGFHDVSLVPDLFSRWELVFGSIGPGAAALEHHPMLHENLW